MENERLSEQQVIARLKEAASTMKKLPFVKVQGYFNAWPDIVYSPREISAMDQKPKKWLATPKAISRTEEVCKWLYFLENIQDRKLVWMRANNKPWQIICNKFGFSRVTANKRWKKSILRITQKHL